MLAVETISVCMEIPWKWSLPVPLAATALGNFFWMEFRRHWENCFFLGADDIMCMFVAFLGKSVNISAALFIAL